MASLVFLNCQSTVLPFQAWQITINTTLFQAWLDHGFKLGRKMWAHHAPENQVLYVMSSLWNPLTLKCWNLWTSIDGFRKKQTDWTYKIHTVFAKLRTTSNDFARGLGDKRSKFLGPSCKFARKPQTSAHSSKVSFCHKTTVFVVLNASVAKEC